MKEKITNVVKETFRRSVVFKKAKSGTSSFRITKKILQNVMTKSKRLKQPAVLIINIPANKQEDYILTCQVKKEKH